jgi:galactose mutarotase-like enzyme
MTHRTTGWNHGWFGGLLATCGLDNVGSPGEDELGPFAQHGHLNGVPARYVSYGARWEAPSSTGSGERYLMWVEGELRQKAAWMPGSYDVVLRRRIESELGGRTISIRDEVENMARTPAPLLLLYHVNLGYPMVGPEAHIVSRSSKVTAHDGAEHDPTALGVSDPTPEHRSQGHAHHLVADADGMNEAAFLNPRLETGLSLRFPAGELPYLAQWKALVQGRYVVALEPTNQSGGNRIRNRERGTLTMLAPGEVRTFHLDLTVLRGANELAAAEERLVLSS